MSVNIHNYVQILIKHIKQHNQLKQNGIMLIKYGVGITVFKSQTLKSEK